VEVAARVLPDSARTAPEAAAAVGVEVGAIVKSLVFRCGDDAVLALVSGASGAAAHADRRGPARPRGGVGGGGHAARRLPDRERSGDERAARGSAELARLAGGRVVRLAAPAR
jgi:hypothetical protein